MGDDRFVFGFSRFKTTGLLAVICLYITAICCLYTFGFVSVLALKPTYAFLLPFGILVSVVAMSSGISGANFWVPVYVIVLNLEPRASFWLALFTMIFGFGSGVVKHFSQNTLRPGLVIRYLLAAAPGALAGTMLLPYVQTSLLLMAFGVFVALYGLRMLLMKKAILGRSEKVTMAVAFTGGMLKGMIATGLGKLMLSRLINKAGVSHPGAVGTTVGVVFFTNIVAVLSIFSNQAFQASLLDNWEQFFSIMVFVAPAVVIGGQIGPRIPKHISKELLMKYVGVLLLCISYYMIMRGVALL